MGKASRRKRLQATSGINSAVERRLAAAQQRDSAEREEVLAYAARVNDHNLSPTEQLRQLLAAPPGVPGGAGRAAIADISRTLEERGWALVSVDFDAIAWDAPIDEETRTLIDSDGDYAEAVVSIATDVMYEIPLFTLTLPHRTFTEQHELAFLHVKDLLALLDLVEGVHIDDDPALVIDAAHGIVDPDRVQRGQQISAAPVRS